MQGPVKEGGAQQTGGRGARRVAPGARKEASDLVVVEDAAIAVVGDSYFVGRFHVGGGCVVAAEPGGQPCPRVGSDRQHRPVESLQGLVEPVEVLAPVRRQEGVGHTKLENGELGPGLQVDGLPDVELEGGVVSGDSLSAVHVDSGAHPFLKSPEAAPRRLLGACAVTDLPGPLREGPPGLHDCLAAGAAVDVLAPPPSSLPTTWLRIVPIFDHKAFLPALVEHFGPGLQVVDEEEAVRLPGRFLVDGLQFLLGQQGRELLENGFQLELVAEAPDAHELHVHTDGGADEPQFLRGHPGRNLHVAPADEESVERTVAGAAVELRLVREIVNYDENFVQFFEAQFLGFAGDLLLLLDDAAEGSLIPLVEVDLLPLRVHAHAVLDEFLDRFPGIVDLDRGAEDVDALEDRLTAGRQVLVQDGADECYRLPRFARPEEDASAGHAGNDRVAWLF